MTREEVLRWFKETAKPIIEDHRGVYDTFYYVYEDNDGYGNYDPYLFYIGYEGYGCTVVTENGCDDCPFRTSHGDCGEYCLYIKEDASIYYEGTDKTYNSEQFDELLTDFL